MKRSLACSLSLSCVLLAGLSPTAHAQCVTDPVWVQMFPDVSPSVRYSPASTQGGKVANGALTAIYYGGVNTNGVQPDLWQWTGRRWVLRVANAGPLSRSNAAARPISDIAPAGSVMFHGGIDPGSNVRGELLLWEDNASGIVTNLGNGPSPRFNHGWAAELNGPGNLMVGGGSCAGLFNEAWFIGTSQTINSFLYDNPAFDPGVNRRWLNTVVYDSARDRFWSLGGSVAACDQLAADGRSYALVNTSWINVPNSINSNRSSSGMAYNPAADQTVVFGGETVSFPSPQGLLGDTWLTPDGGTTWRQLQGPAPSARRAFNALQYVASENQFVLFGGHDGNFLGDTWVLTYKPVFARQPVNQVATPSSPSVTIPANSGGPAHFVRYQILNPTNQQWVDFFNGPLVLNGEQLGTVTLGSTPVSMTFTPSVSSPRTIGTFRMRTFTLAGCDGQVSDTFTISVEGQSCDSVDFNTDGASFDPTDIDAFLSVFSEGPCVPASASCNDIDFNNDGNSFDPCDIDSFLLSFSEGPCTNCGD